MTARKVLFPVMALIVGIALSMILLELIFMVLPVSDNLKPLPVNDSNPVVRFEENRDILWSRGKYFSIVTKKHINNYGFFNDQDYIADDYPPLMAIVGDSYVEAAQVENKDAMHGILSRKTGKRGRVYSFGSSGSPLSNYLAYGKYAVEKFKAKAVVFIIVGNDFDESITKYKIHPGSHQFAQSLDGSLKIVRTDYVPSLFKKFARRSSLVRYIHLNLQINWRSIRGIFNAAQDNEISYVGNTSADTNRMRVSDSMLAIDTFFREIPLQLDLNIDQILFVIDGMRPALYDESALSQVKGSYFDLMRTYFIKTAGNYGYEVIDMEPIFISNHKSTKNKFEFPTDHHWNEYGHSLVADAISISNVYKSLFARQESSNPATD